MTVPKEAITAATKAMMEHVKANSVPVPDAFGTGVSHAFNPSMEACLEVALEAALPHLPRVMAIQPPRPGCVDMEDYARIHNAGFEAAMAAMLAPDVDVVQAPQDWLEDRLTQARAEGIRHAAATWPIMLRDMVSRDTVRTWLLNFANAIHPEQEDATND